MTPDKNIIIKRETKIPRGKLLKIEAKIESNTSKKITKIKITGDFFIYPEEGIDVIEDFLLGKTFENASSIQKNEKELNNILEKSKIKIIGFQIKDLINEISNSLN